MKKWLLNNVWLKLFAIIVAVTLWFYVNGEITKVFVQKPFSDVLVRIVADRDKLLLANYQVSISPEKVDVLLRGDKGQIEKMKKSDLKALVDISEVGAEGIYNLPIRILLPENVIVTKQVNPTSCQVTIRGFKIPANQESVE
ncbi:MAG: CdaR family protein [Candidatus Omnitrophota bacterium]